jgi:hypothetical protein
MPLTRQIPPDKECCHTLRPSYQKQLCLEGGSPGMNHMHRQSTLVVRIDGSTSLHRRASSPYSSLNHIHQEPSQISHTSLDSHTLVRQRKGAGPISTSITVFSFSSRL